MDKVFPVTKLSIQLDSAENSTYTLGDTVKESSLTASTRAANTAILERIAKIPNEKTILDKAQDNATSIMNMATQGYVTIIKNQNSSEYLAVSSENANIAYDPSRDKWKTGTKLWKWSINGLAYSKDGGENFTDAAITMDGAIVANFITTGTMSADRIRTGILQDEKGNTNWNLTTGVLTMKKGEIQLGVSYDYPDGRFSVDDNGYLRSEYGKIGGFVVDAYSIYNDVIRFDSNGLTYYNNESSESLGYYGVGYWTNDPSAEGLNVNLDYKTGFISWGHKDLESDDYFTIKLMYTAVELEDNDGGSYGKDRLHFGTYLQLNHGGFSYCYGGQEYVSTTITSGTPSAPSRAPRKLTIPFNLKKQNNSIAWNSFDCYICNGTIMTL